MQVTTSIWSRSLNRIFGKSSSTGPPSKASRRSTPRWLVLESLERREVFSTDLISAQSLGNSMGSSSANDIAVDTAENSYMTGYFSGVVDFDPSATRIGDTDILTARGTRDAFVAKFDSNNSLMWATRMGGDSNNAGNTDVGRKIAIDGSGNVYISGEFYGPSDFGSIVLSTAGDRDGFVSKLDAGGTIQWANRLGTTADDSAGGISVDSAGNVYAVVSRWRDADDILKFNSAGSIVWSKSVGANGSFNIPDLEVDASGNVFVSGSFTGTVDFDPSSKTKYVSSGLNSSNLNEAGFVFKLDTNGKFGWVSPFVGRFIGTTKGYSYAQSVALDRSGNCVVGGGYRDSVDFNPGSGITTLPTSGGGFIVKLNNSGGLVWARALENAGSGSLLNVSGLASDATNNIYATGYFKGIVDLDPSATTSTQTSAGGTDVFVVKLTSSGNFGWAETFGGIGDDYGLGIAVDTTGDVYLAGFYQGTVDFDPTTGTYYLTNPGTFKNAFRLRLRHS